ncbi:conserved Plasmodium protein, unknown function [Plasmodium knowlesi strain H]|uniref:Transcription initiation factor IIF subunit beta n=3 Tax=Plasmodium knowlesi TaxID=5850 RepID=A0A5K1UWQ3_PLAKH|nr:transcription initiation factor IIF subunit beta, putative [Plasmodium knowlesi strain H]OTN64891.1 Uncharacterized protein PKNOH_S120161200 [Plasmodium knowlesi]CAA9988468.1 transcription initiation factor IIF subunit beta, putative [Plasmodium knowlesi strain H]SBO19781.1 conserved Plasmodium protein, unknown function [Plasmodium knowlesi strain H]SBO20467.1 conserved Plasmodium protein, unknown function [Plasmodium knowlesi strain H]VVS77942.1 transcription initiation factor IIF subunit |eukprot:XP_002259449.1 hypothetical protein, conserved in Plasmodium species [Plasmodium knowlesi strain H]
MLGGKENDGSSKVSMKSKNIKLIKVPKFVSNKWLQYKNKDIVGLLEQNNNEITTLYIQKDDTDNVKKLRCNKSSTLNTYILKQSKVSLNPNKGVSPSSSPSGTAMTTAPTNANSRTSENTSQSKVKINLNNPVKENTEKNKETDYVVCADVLKNCEHTYSFLPTLDEDYSLVLKERHYKTNVKKNRFTIIETRNEENIDSSHTLFKYYTSDDNLLNASGAGSAMGGGANIPGAANTTNDPGLSSANNVSHVHGVSSTSSRDNKMGKSNKRTLQDTDGHFGSSSASKQKAKQVKKMHVFDLDKTKISMFKIFEREGKKGVPFSIFAKSFNIPSNYIKNILDEIAVKKNRVTDKKPVYFLKDCIG